MSNVKILEKINRYNSYYKEGSLSKVDKEEYSKSILNYFYEDKGISFFDTRKRNLRKLNMKIMYLEQLEYISFYKDPYPGAVLVTTKGAEYIERATTKRNDRIINVLAGAGSILLGSFLTLLIQILSR